MLNFIDKIYNTFMSSVDNKIQFSTNFAGQLDKFKKVNNILMAIALFSVIAAIMIEPQSHYSKFKAMVIFFGFSSLWCRSILIELGLKYHMYPGLISAVKKEKFLLQYKYSIFKGKVAIFLLPVIGISLTTLSLVYS